METSSKGLFSAFLSLWRMRDSGHHFSAYGGAVEDIWIVDDGINLANGLKRALKKAATAQNCEDTVGLNQLLGAEITGGYTSGRRLPDGDGIDVLPAILKRYPGARSS